MQSNTALEYNLLNFIEYKELSFWDVKSYLGVIIQSNFDVVKLGKHIKHQNNKIKPNNFPEQDFKILGVNNKTGLFDAYIQKGKEINQPYKIVEDGFLAYNPYRINVGSIGLKLPEHKYKYISPAYVVFSCKSDLLPEYLFAMFKTERFNTIINENTTGSVRQNLSYSRLGQIEIPLPNLNEQKTLVEAYQNRINQADKLEQEATNLEEQIDTFILEELGVNLREVKKRKSGKLYFAEFNELFNWVHSADEATFFEDLQDAKYPVTEIGLAFNFISRSWKKKEESKEYIELGGIDPNFGVMKTKTVYATKAPSRATQIVKTGDLIIGTTRPYLKKFAIIQDENNGDVASSGFSIIQENKEKYNLFFLNEVLKSPIGIKQFEIKMTGALYPAITQADLLALKIPLPSIDIQNNIADSIQQMKDSQKDKFQQAQQLKEQALLDFENAIFKKPTR